MNKENAMKPFLSLPGLLAAVLLAAPVAAGAADILKCVDAAGHVTLTDRPCEPGSTTQRLDRDDSQAYGGSGSAGATGSSGPDLPAAAAPQRYVLPAADLRHEAWRRPAAGRSSPLARDIATLKEARRMQLMQDTPRHSLAGIQ